MLANVRTTVRSASAIVAPQSGSSVARRGSTICICIRRSSTTARSRSDSNTWTAVRPLPPTLENGPNNSSGTDARMPMLSSAPRASDASNVVPKTAMVTSASWFGMMGRIPQRCRPQPATHLPTLPVDRAPQAKQAHEPRGFVIAGHVDEPEPTGSVTSPQPTNRDQQLQVGSHEVRDRPSCDLLQLDVAQFLEVRRTPPDLQRVVGDFDSLDQRVEQPRSPFLRELRHDSPEPDGAGQLPDIRSLDRDTCRRAIGCDSERRRIRTVHRDGKLPQARERRRRLLIHNDLNDRGFGRG